MDEVNNPVERIPTAYLETYGGQFTEFFALYGVVILLPLIAIWGGWSKRTAYGKVKITVAYLLSLLLALFSIPYWIGAYLCASVGYLKVQLQSKEPQIYKDGENDG